MAHQLVPSTPTTQTSGADTLGSERRRAPRRRLRDRIASLDSTQNPALRGRPELRNQMLLVDDDLRQTALVLGQVEKYLLDSMQLLEDPALDGRALDAHADDEALDERMELLAENLHNLRRRMKSIAIAMKSPRGGAAF